MSRMPATLFSDTLLLGLTGNLYVFDVMNRMDCLVLTTTGTYNFDSPRSTSDQLELA